MAYFYCDFTKPDFEDPVNIVGSLVGQICSQLGYFPEKLEVAFAHCGSGGQKRRATLAMLMEILVALAAEIKVILLVDALDECDKRGDFLAAIARLKGSDGIKVIITSRGEPEIQQALHFFKELRIENNLQAVDQDIRNYINHRLESDRKLFWLNPGIKSDIIASLNEKSQGM
jgi:hypothetical protein